MSRFRFKALLETDRFVYHKDTSIGKEQVKAKLDLLKESGSRLEFYDAHTPNAKSSLQAGARGMSTISGSFYPEILVWMCDNATNPGKQAEVEWLQQELIKVDPLIHVAYPLSAKYFLGKRGLPVRTISRAHALELTPQQKQALNDIHNSFQGWCEKLEISPVDVASLVQPRVPLDSPI